MSLFGGDSKLTPKEDITVGLAELGGGAVGLGVGALAGIPLDIRYQNKSVEQAQQLYNDRQASRKHWETLLDLTKGKLSLEDLPEEKRSFYEKQLKDLSDDLHFLKANPLEARKSLRSMTDTGEVVKFPHNNKSTLKNIFPQLGDVTPEKLRLISPNANTKLRLHKVRHPASRLLPGALGVVGFVSGGAALKNHYLKENENE